MTATPAVPLPTGPWSLIGEPAFRRVWLSGGLIGVVRWIEFLATGVYVFEITHSPVQVALMTMLRMLPLPLLGAFSGALAEQVSRRSLLLAVLALGISASAVQGWLAWSGQLQLWHLALGAVISGVFWAVDMPLRRTLLGELAGHGRTAAAMGLDSATNNATRMLGPGVGGLLLETVGIKGAFALGAVLFLLSFALMWSLKLKEAVDRAGNFRILARILEGLRIVRDDRALVGTLAVTIIYNVFAWPVTSMVPVIGEHHLHLSAFPVGLLMSADGLGALVGALLIASGAKPEHFRGTYLVGVALYAAASLVFASSPWPLLSGAAQVTAGLGGACFATMQATIVFLSAPVTARPRVMGVLSVCIGSSVLGFLQLGMLANWLGGPSAVITSSICGLVTLALAALIWPEIRPKAPFKPR